MTSRVILLLVLVILIQHETDGWLRRRRRRQPPHCRPTNCHVSEWSPWSRCGLPCGNSGTQSRARIITRPASCGGSCPYHISERRACNRNACQNGGTPLVSSCKCKPGYAGTCCEIVIPTTPPKTVQTTAPTTAPTTIPTTAPATEATTTPPTTTPTTAATTEPATEPTTAATTAPTTIPTTAPATEATTTPATAATTEPATEPTTAATTAPTTVPTTAPATEPATELTTSTTLEPTTAPTPGPTTEAQTTTASTVAPTTEPASVSPSCDGGYLPHTKCSRVYVKVGAFKENWKDRAMPVLLLTDRDCSSKQNDGHLLDWYKFQESIHSLACRCAEQAKQRKWKVFGLQNYAECWSGPGAEHTFAKYGTAGPHNAVQILTNTTTLCDKKNPQECIGKNEINYVYRLQ